MFFDEITEQCVIGACLVSARAVEDATRILITGDFGTPHAAAAFDAIAALHTKGSSVDPVTVLDECRLQGTAWEQIRGDLLGWASSVPAPSDVARYAAIVTRFGSKRALHDLGVAIAKGAANDERDPLAIIDEARERLGRIDSPTLARSPGDVPVDEFLGQIDEDAPPVIAGLLNEDDRVIIVAKEGLGKSELTRQIVACASWGIHPFTLRPTDAVPVLLADMENPRALLRDRLGVVTALCRTHSSTQERATLWHRPGGIDLRSRADRAAFEDVLRRNKPRLVALGPVYKVYTRRGSESDEQVASEVQTILDDLRTRHGFALLLEHHAPQAAAGYRDIRPFGSSLWLRWPEFGIALKEVKGDDSRLALGRWRGDRVRSAGWPDEVVRGDVWPWVGRWEQAF